MEITNEQYQKIAKYLPKQSGNVKISNLQLINAILYVAENSCLIEGIAERVWFLTYSYVRLNRWSKNGVLKRVFAGLQTEGILEVRV